MTEAEWLDCTEAHTLLTFLETGCEPSGRKLRLFSVAYYRRMWNSMTKESHRKWVEANERLADGEISLEKWNSARWAAGQYQATMDIRRYATLEEAFRDDALEEAWGLVRSDVGLEDTRENASVLRDIFGNPFRPSPPLPPTVLRWSDGTVRRIAKGIYEDRKMPAGTLDTARLAILADALIDGGCQDEDLIAHCRSSGPHVRGCWAVDLILGKE